MISLKSTHKIAKPWNFHPTQSHTSKIQKTPATLNLKVWNAIKDDR